MRYCNKPLEWYNFTKICQIFISKMSTISDLTNHIMIPGACIIYHDTRSWYHRMAASIECLQAPSLRLGTPGACSQASNLSS